MRNSYAGGGTKMHSTVETPAKIESPGITPQRLHLRGEFDIPFSDKQASSKAKDSEVSPPISSQNLYNTQPPNRFDLPKNATFCG